MFRSHATGTLAILILMYAGVAFANDKCSLQQVASLDLGTDDMGAVYVPVGVNHHTVNLRVDTGSAVSNLTYATVRDLALPFDGPSRRSYAIMGGRVYSEVTHADTLQFGTVTKSHVELLMIPDDRLPTEESGMLARDILGDYDMELDFVKAKFNLFLPNHCTGQVVYWTQDAHAQVPFHIDPFGRISTTVDLDGKSIPAVLDTGYTLTTMGFEAARDLFGWEENNSDLKLAGHQPDGTPGGYWFPFKTLTISGVTVRNPRVLLVVQLNSHDFRIGSMKPQLVIGMEVLRQLHIYFAYQEQNLYATAADAR